MLGKRPWDNIEQILIVISFKWLLARWWMGANLPLCRALERVFNMTIKCLSVRFYCIFLSLSCRLLCTPPPFFTSQPLSSCSVYLSLFTSLHLYSAAFAQIKLRLQFSPSQSTYLCFMTRTESILCCYWFFHPLLITLLLKSTQTILPFAPWFLPLLSCGDLKCMTKTEKNIYEGGRGCLCMCLCWSLKHVAPSEKHQCRPWCNMKRYDQKVAG